MRPGARACPQGARGIVPVLLMVLFLIANNVQAASGYAGKVSHVLDGDTLWVVPEGGGPARKIRIDGIDAPEICQAGGPASRDALVRLVMRHRVEVMVRRQDDYGRALARIRIDGQDVGALMVREGQAWSYRWRRDAGPYAAEEAKARQASRGLFATGGPEMPRDFRRRHGPCPAPAR